MDASEPQAEDTHARASRNPRVTTNGADAAAHVRRLLDAGAGSALVALKQALQDYALVMHEPSEADAHPLGEEHVSNAVRVARTALVALEPGAGEMERALLSDLCDLAEGAAKPGSRFRVDLAELVGLIDRWRTADRQASWRKGGLDGAPGFVQMVRCMLPKLPIFDWLSSDACRMPTSKEAMALLDPLFNRCVSAKLEPTGVVVELLHAALKHGVRFERGANISAGTHTDTKTVPRGDKQGRTRLAKLVDNACREYAHVRHRTARQHAG